MRLGGKVMLEGQLRSHGRLNTSWAAGNKQREPVLSPKTKKLTNF